ncbi:MAG: thioredoxin-like domain-containing protein [Dokdonella sp.]
MLYFFHRQCPHCIASEAAISRIAARLRGSPSLQFVGISAASDGELDAYRRTSAGPFPLAQLDANKMFSLFRISALPTLLLVDKAVIGRSRTSPVRRPPYAGTRYGRQSFDKII